LWIVIEILGNTEFSACQGFRPAAFPSSRSGCQRKNYARGAFLSVVLFAGYWLPPGLGE
jgi:hypothetical protein